MSLPIEERPVGNQFPETNGAAPFSCLVSYTRLVLPEDVKKMSSHNKDRPKKGFLMEQRKQRNTAALPEQFYDSSTQDENNYTLLQGVSCLCLGDEKCSSLSQQRSNSLSSVCQAHECDHDGCNQNVTSVVIMKHHQCQQDHENDQESDYVNVSCFQKSSDIQTLSEESTTTSSISVSSSFHSGSQGFKENVDHNEKLSTFNRLCSQTRRLIKEYQVKFDQLPSTLRIELDISSINSALDKMKSFRSEVEDGLGELLERCKLNMETILRYSEIMPSSSYERKMSNDIHDMQQTISSLDQDIYGEIEALKNFSVIYQNLQECYQERLSRFAVIKTRLVQVERNLVKDESGLNLRLKGIQSIVSVLERSHRDSNSEPDPETVESTDMCKLISQIRPYDYIVDISRVVTQSQDLILAEKQLLLEVKMKRALLLSARESFEIFLERQEKFHSWYNDYMRRLGETRVTGPDFDVLYPSLVTEREEKRKEFIDILASARNLRASIFDSSAVNEKIEVLQQQWKVLVEKVYRARSRRTV